MRYNKVMSVIDDYLVHIPKEYRAELERVRAVIRAAAPNTTEVISYGIPAFKYKDKYLIGFAAYKNHLSIFPSSAPIEVLKHKLGAFKLSRGTIQFALDNPVPDDTIRELVAVRKKAIDTAG